MPKKKRKVKKVKVKKKKEHPETKLGPNEYGLFAPVPFTSKRED